MKNIDIPKYRYYQVLKYDVAQIIKKHHILYSEKSKIWITNKFKLKIIHHVPNIKLALVLSSAVDRMFESRSSQIKDFKIVMCC